MKRQSGWSSIMQQRAPHNRSLTGARSCLTAHGKASPIRSNPSAPAAGTYPAEAPQPRPTGQQPRPAQLAPSALPPNRAHPGHHCRSRPSCAGAAPCSLGRHAAADIPSSFATTELSRLCLNALRAPGRPTRVRETTALVLTAKGLDPLDRALADATVKHNPPRVGEALPNRSSQITL